MVVSCAKTHIIEGLRGTGFEILETSEVFTVGRVRDIIRETHNPFRATTSFLTIASACSGLGRSERFDNLLVDFLLLAQTPSSELKSIL